MFVETLTLLHQQVVMATEEQIYASYTYYLLIMKKVGSQPEIDQGVSCVTGCKLCDRL